MFQYSKIDLSKCASTIARVCFPTERKTFIFDRNNEDGITDMIRLKSGNILNSATHTAHWAEVQEWLDNTRAVGDVYDALPYFMITIGKVGNDDEIRQGADSSKYI